MRIMADVGLRAGEYEIANSPAEAILERPFPQFPFNIMDIKDGHKRDSHHDSYVRVYLPQTRWWDHQTCRGD